MGRRPAATTERARISIAPRAIAMIVGDARRSA